MPNLNIFLLSIITIMFNAPFAVASDESNLLVRLSKLEIDPARLEAYKLALKEEIEDSIRIEPGVLTLYAVFEKEVPNRLTILEIYASRDAYKSHIETPHFLKYKNGTLEMVTKLELIDGNPLLPHLKIKDIARTEPQDRSK